MPKPTETASPPLSIGFCLLDRFSNLCLSNALEPLRAANGFAAKPRYRWRFFSLDGEPVRSSSGLRLLPDAPLQEMAPVDRLYVIASYGHLELDRPATRRALHRAGRRAGLVLGLDAGAWLLAGAGFLEGRRATLHWDLVDAFSERFLDIQVERSLWVADGPVITCAGAMATLDLSRHFICVDLGAAVALDVEALLSAPPPGEVTSLSGAETRDPLLARMSRLMRATLEQPLPLAELARQLGTSPRTLTRRCKARIGQTPGQFYRHIRLSAARQMVEAGPASVTEIALRCGYEDPTALTRAFRRRFGQSPRALRRAIAT